MMLGHEAAAVDALMSQGDKDSASHGAKGSLVRVQIETQSEHTHTHTEVWKSNHRLELAHSAPRRLNPPEYIAAC